MDAHSRLILEALQPLLKVAKAGKACAESETLYRSLCAASKHVEEALQPREARTVEQPQKRAA